VTSPLTKGRTEEGSNKDLFIYPFAIPPSKGGRVWVY